MKTQLIKPAYEVKINPPYTPNYRDEIVRNGLRLAREEFKHNKVAIPSTVDFSAKDGDVKGSTYYFVNILAGKINALTGGKIRPANAREIQLFLRYGLIEDAGRTYDDPGLTFYSNKDFNSRTYDHLCLQIASEGWKKKFEHVEIKKPFILTGSVDVHPDSNFDNGLRIDINDFTEVYNHPALLKGGRFNSNDPGLIETGFPYNLGEGDRELFVTNSGVRWFCRGRDLGLGARDGDLGDSSDAGRGRFVEIFSSGNEGLVTLAKRFHEEQELKAKSLHDHFERKRKEVQSIIF